MSSICRARKLMLVMVMSAYVAGCAGVPDVKYSYYGVQWSAVATATQTIGCSADNKILANHYTPFVTSTFSSDYSQPEVMLKSVEF